MVNIFGVNIDNISKEEALERVRNFLFDGFQHYLVTINPEIILKAQKNNNFQNILNSADLKLADGIGVIFASMILGNHLKERIAGIDFIYDILNSVKPHLGIRIMIVGAEEKSRKKACLILKKQFPRLNIYASRYTIDFTRNPGELFFLLNREIKMFGPQILFVAFGAPYQERWIFENLSMLPSVRIAMGVGGAIDMISGRLPRAPFWLRKIGLEWLWRLWLEPKRWRRIVNAVVIFPWMIIKRKFKYRKLKWKITMQNLK